MLKEHWEKWHGSSRLPICINPNYLASASWCMNSETSFILACIIFMQGSLCVQSKWMHKLLCILIPLMHMCNHFSDITIITCWFVNSLCLRNRLSEESKLACSGVCVCVWVCVCFFLFCCACSGVGGIAGAEGLNRDPASTDHVCVWTRLDWTLLRTNWTHMFETYFCGWQAFWSGMIFLHTWIRKRWGL